MNKKGIQLFEAEAQVCVLQEIKPNEALECIASFIDGTFVGTDFAELHNKKEYKPYTFSSLYKPEINRNYQAGTLYSFRIRSISKELMDHFRQNLGRARDANFQGISTRQWQVRPRHITKLYSITPAVMKNDSGYWQREFTFDDVIKRLTENAYKKYHFFTQETADETCDLFTQISVQNGRPIGTMYKGIQLLGDKFELEIASNTQAQAIAQVLLGCGIMENSARGLGYVNAKWL